MIVRVSRVLLIEQLHERPIIRPWNVDVEIQLIDVFFPRTTGLEAGRAKALWVYGMAIA